MTALFDEFEAWSTPEARFAHVMDNLQPLLLNNSNGGADWKAHGVKAAQVRGRQGRNRLGSERFGELTESIIAANIAKGILPEE